MTRCVTHAAMLVSILVSVGTAAEPPASDEAAVRRAGKDYVAALERGDFKTAASFWTAKGTYTDETGKTWPGQQLLEQAPTSGANDRPQSNVSHVTVTFIAPDAALEEGEGECRADQGLAQMCGRFTAAWVKQDGGWRLARLIETRARVVRRRVVRHAGKIRSPRLRQVESRQKISAAGVLHCDRRQREL